MRRNRTVGRPPSRALIACARIQPSSARPSRAPLERDSEGLVGKDEASRYRGGRTLAWLKVKQPHYREGERGWEPKREPA